MSRISLMLIVACSLVVSRSVTTSTAITVVDARGDSAEKVRGGNLCALVYVGGYCIGFDDGPCEDQGYCSQGLDPDDPWSGVLVWLCPLTKRKQRESYYWNNCTPYAAISIYETCKEPETIYCWETSYCKTKCVFVLGLRRCRTDSNPELEHFLSEDAVENTEGNFGACVLHSAISPALPSNIAAVLPSFHR